MWAASFIVLVPLYHKPFKNMSDEEFKNVCRVESDHSLTSELVDQRATTVSEFLVIRDK